MKNNPNPPRYPALTGTEKQILILCARDLKCGAIAKLLGRSDHTPKNHIYNIKTKMRVSTIGGAITRAHQLGEIDLDTVVIIEPENEK
jgi:DNA-binding CsgD family transcriptional regulator